MQVLRASADFEVVGVVEPDAKLAAAAQAIGRLPRLPFLTEEQLLNTPGLAAVVVETNVPDLLAAGERVIDAGKHLHLEKPGGASLPRFRQLLDAATRKHLVVQLGYMYRYNPGIVLLRDLLRQGYLAGEPFEVQAVMSKVVNPTSRRALRRIRRRHDVRAGCHLIDLTIGLAGPARHV